jgi:alkylation response protein AidB-like acyl-CoA dehydrogenase
MWDTIGECERSAHAEGLAAGLATALAGMPAGAPPGSVAAVPSNAVDLAGSAWGETLVPHDLAAREGISFVRCQGRAPVPTDELTAFGARLGAVRLGVHRRLLQRAVEHLAGRLSGGEPILRKQLVQGTLADILAAGEAVRRCLLVAGDAAAAVADAHDRLTVLDWEAAKLLGASGYLSDGPARGAWVSRLTANCWIVRGQAA